MSLQFTAETIFEIGVQIEKNGQAFYQYAAEHAAMLATLTKSM